MQYINIELYLSSGLMQQKKGSGLEPSVRVHSDPEPEPPLRFGFDGLAEPEPRT